MIAFFRPQALFTDLAILKETKHKTLLPNNNKANDSHSHAVVVFSHHRDVKVALEELSYAGFSSDCLTLIARHAQRLDCSGLVIKSCFDPKQFDFNQIAQDFFSRLFKRGKYLVLIDGGKYDVNAASKIASRRQNHAKVWHFE